MKTVRFRRPRRRWLALFALPLFLLLMANSSCSGSGHPSGTAAESHQQTVDTDTLVAVLPVPDFANSEIRENLIEIEAIEALGVKSTTFAFQQGDPNPIWSCPSEGLPVPITDELTNPETGSNYTDGNGNYNTVPVGQMDPNGIYQGDGSGTDVLCLDAKGDPYVHYWEGNVDAVTSAAHWDTTKHSVVTDGAPVTPLCTVKTRNTSSGKQDYESCSVPQGSVVTSAK